MSITPPVLGKLTIPALTPAVALVRRWLTGILDGRPAMSRDDIVLLACEAVTNSIRYFDSGADDQGNVIIVVFDVDDAVRVEVIDAGSVTKVPRMFDEDTDALSGRGLRMVDAMSGGRWGTYADRAKRTVWFEVPISERGAPEYSGR